MEIGNLAFDKNIFQQVLKFRDWLVIDNTARESCFEKTPCKNQHNERHHNGRKGAYNNGTFNVNALTLHSYVLLQLPDLLVI